MKKVIFFLFMVISNISFGQLLIVTPYGLKDANDNNKPYVVIMQKDKSAKQLYFESINFINKYYKSANDVIKGKIEGEYLKFITYAPSFTTMKNVLARPSLDAKYTTELSFKDGKIKYEIIELEILVQGGLPLHFEGSGINSFYIFNTKGKVVREDAKSGIERYFNGQISIFSTYLQNSGGEEW